MKFANRENLVTANSSILRIPSDPKRTALTIKTRTANAVWRIGADRGESSSLGYTVPSGADYVLDMWGGEDPRLEYIIYSDTNNTLMEWSEGSSPLVLALLNIIDILRDKFGKD